MGDPQRKCAPTIHGSGLSHWADCPTHGKVEEGNGAVTGSKAKVQAAVDRHKAANGGYIIDHREEAT